MTMVSCQYEASAPEGVGQDQNLEMVFVINQGVVANMSDLSMVFTGFSQRKQTLPVDPIKHRFMRVTGTLY